MLLKKRLSTALIPLVTLLSVLTFLTSCGGKKQATTDCDQMQVQSGEQSLTVGYIPPSKGLFGIGEESVLMLYLHGLGANWQQPFILPYKHTYADAATHFKPGITFMSSQFGAGGKWAGTNSFDDITNSIKAIDAKYPSKKIILTGCSMGASTALTYATQAPPEIRDRIVGIVAMYPAGDFVELHDKTTTALVKAALEQCFGGTPEDPEVKKRYLEMSLIPHVASFPKTTKVYVMSAMVDATIPPALQKALVESLKANGVPVQLEEINCSHDLPPSNKSFVKGLKFILD